MRNTLLLLLLAGACWSAAAAETVITPRADLRLRQEVLDDVLYFAPDPDRDQVRVRSRAGLEITRGRDTVNLLLANEPRHYLHPDGIDFDWDELIVDQLHWDHRDDGYRLTVGRQNIIWDEGFLMLEGKPHDGSRSIFHDAVRLRVDRHGRKFDAALIVNAKRDPLVLAGDQDRALRDADEIGLAVRVEGGRNFSTYIFKQEDDPDSRLPFLTTHTVSAGRRQGHSQGLLWMYHLAGQYQVWDKRYYVDDRTGWGFALHARLEGNLGERTRGELGVFYYDDQFRTPWGRWPMWSELYIYTLIGESTPGRTHVAAWENIAAPFVGARHPFSPRITGRARAYYLMAPEPSWEARGVLLQTRLDLTLSDRLSGHLLWEMLDPGEYPNFADATKASAADVGTAHFLRWEFILKL